MLTNEERDVVVAAMRKYPAGVNSGSWGKSDEFLGKSCIGVESLSSSILLDGG